jgi:hypothetical protein
LIGALLADKNMPAMPDRGAMLGEGSREQGLKVDITGYTDETGDKEKNIELAKHRAQAVQDALVAEGLTLEFITLKPPLFHKVLGTTGTGTDVEARRVETNKSGIMK